MPRARRVSLIPTTPGGIHLRIADISADAIEIDDEVVIRSSVFRGVSTVESVAEQSNSPQEAKSPKRTPKYVVRKSTDLKKIRNINDRIDAILASPMIENRRRPLGHSKSLETNDNERTPLRVPSSHDLQAISSRRMSAIVMSKFAPYLHSNSFTEGENKDLCSTKLNRRKTTGNFTTSTHPLRLSLGASLHKNTPVTDAPNNTSTFDNEPLNVDSNEDVENVQPPLSQRTPSQEPIPSTSQPYVASKSLSMAVADDEPRSVGEFRVLVNMEISRLSALKGAWEDVVEEEGSNIPEAAITHIRAAVGKCGLLIKKRLQTFFGLIDYTEESLRKQEQGDINELTSHQRSNINDLLGMWTNIARQIRDIDKSFDRLRRWRDVSKWAFSSPPATPAPPPKQKSTSHLPRPAWKSKGTLKRLVPATSTTASQLRPKIVKKSNLTLIKAQMLAKKRALEAGGNTDEIVVFGGSKSGGLHSPVSRRGPLNEESVSRSSGRRGRPRKSECVQPEATPRTVDLSPPVHESHQIDIGAAGHSPETAEGIVYPISFGEESDVIEESVEIQSPRSRGGPRQSTILETSAIESELLQEERGNLQSSENEPVRPESVRATKSSQMHTGGSSLIVRLGTTPEKAVGSPKTHGKPGKSSSIIQKVEEGDSLLSSKRGRPKKSVTTTVFSIAKHLFQENNKLHSPKLGTPKFQNTSRNLQSSKPRGRPRKSSVLEPETAELNARLYLPTSNVTLNMAEEENVEIQSPKHNSPRKSAATESFHTVNSEMQTPKRGRPRKSIERQSAEISQSIQSPVRVKSKQSSIVEVIDVDDDEISAEQAVIVEGISSHQSAASNQPQFFEVQQELKSPKRGRPRKSAAESPAVSETQLQVIDVDIHESAAVRRRGRSSRQSSLFVPDSQFSFVEGVGTLQSPKPRGGTQHSIIINDSLDQNVVVPTPKRGRSKKSIAVVNDSILAAERTPKPGRPRKSAVEAMKSSTPAVSSAKQRGSSMAPVEDVSLVKQTPNRGRSRQSMAIESAVKTPGTTSVLSSAKLGRPRKSVSIVQNTASSAVGTASRKRRPSRLSEVIASENSAGGNFLIPDSLPRKRPRMDQSSILSTSQASTVASTTNPFSPPPRPITGTPRPHMSKLMRTKVDSSLTQSVLRKQLMLATTCGGNNSGRSSTEFAVKFSQSNTGKRSVGRPRKSVRFLGSPDPQSSSTKASLPVTPHVRSSTDPIRRVSQRGRRPKLTP